MSNESKSDSAEPPIPTDFHAKFNPLIRPYMVLTIGLTIASTCIGIPLALIWFLGVGQWWARHYFEKLECALGTKSLRFRKGILVQVEKTIPLENIQDVTFIEGPLLRRFHLSTVKFETAGHSAGQANDMHLTGIIDAHDFRNKIMEAREALKQQAQRQISAPQIAAAPASDFDARAAIQGIEVRLDRIIELLQQRGEK